MLLRSIRCSSWQTLSNLLFTTCRSMSAMHVHLNVIFVDVGYSNFKRLKRTRTIVLPRIRMKNAASTQLRHGERRLLWCEWGW